MGQVRKVGDSYYIEFYARGLMYSQIAGRDPEAAQRLLEETENKIAAGEALTQERHIHMAVFFERFLESARGEYSASTVRRFAQLTEHFGAFLRRECPSLSRLDEITPRVLEQYKASRCVAVKPHIVNLTLLLLKDMLDHGIKLGFINDNPMIHVKLLPAPRRRIADTGRSRLARELLGKGVGLSRLSLLLKLDDVGRTMYFANFIPLTREDMYN